MIELDHLFRLVVEPGPVLEALERGGFRLDEGTRHVGQGTRNRRVNFARTFFEVLWVDDLEVARANELRLDLRVGDGARSIGVCWRGDVAGAFGDQLWLHHPPYMPTLAIHLRRDEPTGPLHFGFQRETPEDRERHWPANRQGMDPRLLEHPNGAREITSWRIDGATLVVALHGLSAVVEAPRVVRFEPE
ncbi:MAG: VOC family protein [Myxococcaceae bacterium]|nr:VOC family protein [Myxococcaceae bacterium]